MKRYGGLRFNSIQEGELWPESGQTHSLEKESWFNYPEALIFIFLLFAKVQMHPVKKASAHPGTGHGAQWKNVGVFNDHNKLLTFFRFSAAVPPSICSPFV